MMIIIKNEYMNGYKRIDNSYMKMNMINFLLKLLIDINKINNKDK